MIDLSDIVFLFEKFPLLSVTSQEFNIIGKKYKK